MSSGDDDGGQRQIHQTTLKGHKASVLCLAHSSETGDDTGSGLLSGSEDGTARLWDLRTSSRAALCIIVPGQDSESHDVNSVAFGTPPPTLRNEAALPSSPFCHEFFVFLSVANHVYGYDLRNVSSPIVREFANDLSAVLESADEINQISLSPTGRNNSSRELHLAVAEDGGTVRVTSDCFPPPPSTAASSSTRQSRRRVLHHDVEGLAMVTCAEFRPKCHKSLDLASAGTDCTIHLWDVVRPRRPSSTVRITTDDAGANQVCNPPMVHSLSWSPSGRLLAAGLGDGTCSILRVNGRTLTQVGRLREGHDAAVASVMFPEFMPSLQQGRSFHVASNDRLLASAGNDGAIFMWDLGPNIGGDGALNPATMFADNVITPSEPQTLEGDMEGLSLSSNDSKILFGIHHTQKPNWLSSNRGSSPPSLFVADTTNNITAYTLPIR